MFESTPLETLAAEGQLSCYGHHGFWQCMDTMRTKRNWKNYWQKTKRHGKYGKRNGHIQRFFSGQASLSRVIRDSRVPG